MIVKMIMTQFKEKLQQIQEVLKEIPGVHLHDIRTFCDGKLSVTKKGELKLPLSLPANEVMNQPNDLNSVIQGNWKIVPILMFVEE